MDNIINTMGATAKNGGPDYAEVFANILRDLNLESTSPIRVQVESVLEAGEIRIPESQCIKLGEELYVSIIGSDHSGHTKLNDNPFLRFSLDDPMSRYWNGNHSYLPPWLAEKLDRYTSAMIGSEGVVLVGNQASQYNLGAVKSLLKKPTGLTMTDIYFWEKVILDNEGKLRETLTLGDVLKNTGIETSYSVLYPPNFDQQITSNNINDGHFHYLPGDGHPMKKLFESIKPGVLCRGKSGEFGLLSLESKVGMMQLTQVPDKVGGFMYFPLLLKPIQSPLSIEQAIDQKYAVLLRDIRF